MSKELPEVFCTVCGRSSNDDKYFHRKDCLCNRHYLQIKRHGAPTGKDRGIAGEKKDYCEVCNDKEHKTYYVWNRDGELYGKTLCGKHYNQMLNHNRITDTSPSDHIDNRKAWTEEEKIKFEELYKQGLSFEEISKILDRGIGSLNTMSSKLKLGYKYMRPNNPHFKAIYQDYDWCYERYINRRMSFEEMAEEAGCTKRVIEKWCGDVHKLNYHTIKYHIHLSDLQRQLIMFSLLGDGHIDKRETQPIFIVSHAENQKDYLFWKYEILKNLCNKEPSYIPEQYKNFSNGNWYLCQPQYRIATKIIMELSDIRKIEQIDIIKQLNEFGLSIHLLDDGSRNESNWELCLAEYTQEEIDLYIQLCKERFDLNSWQEKDKRYILFDAESSKKLDKIILRSIPNDLDVIKYKILDKEIA